ncbi:MAG: zinc-dependent metalloprotease [Bacteroidota bacterium]
MQNFTLNSVRYGMLTLLLLALSFPSYGQRKKKKSAEQSTETTTAEKPKGPMGGGKANPDSIMPYDQIVTTKAVSDTGLFTVHKVGSKYYFELANDLLEQEILVVSRIAGTVEGLSFGGAGMKSRPQQVIRWQRMENKILLRSVSYNSVASMDEPIYKSVQQNNFEPVIMTFKIEAYNKDTTGIIFDASQLFTSDVAMIGALSSGQRKNFEVRGLDSKRSFISWMHSFPQNTEVRHVLTYNAGKAPSNGLTGTISLEMNQSFILLPEEPMIPRLFDQRVGYFSVAQYQYGEDQQKATQKTYITKWKLVPSDIEAYQRGELVEPVEPIIYYIDPNTPMKWRPYLKQGVEDWNKAFEAAGFKNAIKAMDAPTPEEDPEWSPEDVRYSVIRYVTNPIQNAQGPHVHDPRTGQILESDILWYHNVMNLLRNWFFIQTSAINEEAQGVAFKDEIMGRLIRFVSAHEVGHTLGLPHNMGSSAAYPVDSLRSRYFTAKFNTAPSIMDYARFNYVAQPEDEGVALMPDVGPYDKWSIKWGYTYFPDAETSEDERATLNQWVLDRANDPVYRFGRQQRGVIDPSSQTEDLGDDAVKASTYGIANLKRIMPNLITWTAEDGKDFKDLNELYGQVLNQYNRYMGHVANNIGGVYEYYKTYDQNGTIYEHVPKERQEAAMAFLQEQLFTTPTWLIDQEILLRIEHAGIVNRMREYQVRTLNNLLDMGRLARMIENEALNGESAYGMLEMMGDLREGLFKELIYGDEIDTYRRNLQRAYLERMEFLMTSEQAPIPPQARRFITRTNVDVSQSDIRPIVRAEVKALDRQIARFLPRVRDNMTRIHLQDMRARIADMLDED